MPQILQHLEQMQRIEAAAAARAAAAGRPAPTSPLAPREQQVAWVQRSASASASLVESMLSEAAGASSEEELLGTLGTLAALPPHMLTPAQRAALVLAGWDAAAHAKPAGLDSGLQLMMPGLADVAVVSRGGWHRRSWKGCNQDAFLAVPLASGPDTRHACPSAPACPAAPPPAAIALGVFDGHGRAGQAAAAHLRNALASGLLLHTQLARVARPACQRPGCAQAQESQGDSAAAAAAGVGSEAGGAWADAAGEAAALLERCFAAAAATMPSTGADFSLSGSTAVMCLVQPGSVTAAWVGDSRAVLGLHHSGRYVACALTRDHKPGSPLERARIEQAGGWVMQTLVDAQGQPAGPHRVYLRESTIPGLAVSRCFGDYVAVSAGVTSTPDVTTFVLPTAPAGGGGSGAGGALRRRRDQQQRQRQPPQQQGQQQQQQQGHAKQLRPQTVGNQPRRSAEQGSGAPRQRQQSAAADAALPQPPQPRQQQRPRLRGQALGGGRQAGGQPGASPARHVLIVASDGLWEFVSNAEAVRIASMCPNAQAAAECLVLEAQAQWAVEFGGRACDDITVAVAFLPDLAC